MTSKLAGDRFARHYQCESLEERLALTLNALADLPELVQFSGIDSSIGSDAISAQSLQTFAGNSAQQVDAIREQFSFDGTGQTVAVIDSGIAWDHYALGGGFGEDFRVVGGWDFAENDSNPFDDGPGGFHGTHVAGIIGSDDAQHTGVAAGVDLVGLRVFDDMGSGKIEWVEKALQWVHEHRNDFENPITTVNLSLGFNWHSNSVPNWATLEDEFAQLQKDGIFISVAAGNSFQKYLTKGVSYPAASKSVVPVASHGSDGTLSDFSQRNDRVLVAPGEGISSTIPAHIYGMSGPSSRFMATSGTSMAAPFVAGASTLLREAFEIAGETNINQHLLYQHFHETADQVYDSITSSWYSRLNLKAAIEAALEDGHGNSTTSATRLGSISKLDSFNGILAESSDVDYFRFTADQSGLVTMTLDASHDLSLQSTAVGQNIQRNGNTISFQVNAGQDYVLRFSGTKGQGHYDVDVKFETTFQGVKNLGQVRSNTLARLTNQGVSHYQVTAARNAILTIEAITGSNNNLAFEVYDSSEKLVGSSRQTGNGLRADIDANKGDTFTIKIIGNQDSFDLKFTNLVRTTGDRIIVGGTGQSDSYTYQSQVGEVNLIVNGTQYQFSKSEFTKVRLNGGTGNDRVVLSGSNASENLSGGSGYLVFYGSQTDVIARSFETSTVYGNGGDDMAVIHDSASSDYFLGTSTRSSLSGGGYRMNMVNFERVTAISSRGGNDRAELIGTSGNDFLHIHRDGTSLSGHKYQNYVIGFENVNATGNGGLDEAYARGTTARETLTVNGQKLTYVNAQGNSTFQGFEDVTVNSGGGRDHAIFNSLNSTDSIAQGRNSVTADVSGQSILLEAFDDVDWSAGIGESPFIGTAAVEKIFDLYADK